MLSISAFVDAEDIYAEIRMERQAHAGSFLLLEGTTDIRRFTKFLAEDCSTVNCWGKNKLISVVRLAENDNFPGALGLADADFDRITGEITETSHLIYSDTHDFDLDCALSDLLQNYLLEVGDEEKVAGTGGAAGVSKALLEALYPLSCARLANIRGTIQVSLAEVEWDTFFVPYKINMHMYAAKALKKVGATHESVAEFLETVTAEASLAHDLRQVTNGHDFCVALGVALREGLGTRGKQQTSGREIELHLRLGFQNDHFDGGEVSKRVRVWELENEPFVILKKR